MAVSLSSTPSFLYAPLSTSKPHSNSHNIVTLPFKFSSNNNKFLSLPIRFSLSSSVILCENYNNNTSHVFKCSASSHENATQTMDEGQEVRPENEESADTSAKKQWESVETLTRFYKEAVLAGDFHTVTEIETSLYRLEAEKNDLVVKVSALSEEITSGKEKYIRLQADFDNFRKRAEKERLSVRTDAQGEVIESFLAMVDNFERAKQQIKPETDREKQIDTSYQGIYKQFVEVMRSLRVAAVATVGKPFDPALHEAIAREESEEFKEGIVSQEFRRGFLLGDRLLRPAMVKVSTGPGKKGPASVQNSPEQPTAAAAVDEH